MHRNLKIGLIITSICIILSALIYYNRYKITRLFNANRPTTKVHCNSCNTYFPDNVKTQAKAYTKKGSGIQPQKHKSDLLRLVKKGELVPVEKSAYYELAHLSHSYPFVKPCVNTFLNTLSETYKKKCEARGLDYYPFEIVSLTRSIQSVRELTHDNPWAIKNSAHLRGKTLDINIYGFNGYQKNLDAFVSALRELRNKNQCYVKFESNGCLHITVR
ncbi:MAG: hypothetical protein FGM54_01330 [Chitinophagaceae bacterium]|nr:hypothetical protein [Chitinophagaceae bacterium]